MNAPVERQRSTRHPKILNALLPEAILQGAQALRQGGIVAFPTETVYGLGADATDPKAVCRLFEVKKRPAFDPLIVHAPTAERAFELWEEVPDAARRLAKYFWPGPLTIVLPKRSAVPDVVTAGLPTVAVRVPRHPVALSLLEAFGRPIAAPSANLFGHTSPTTADAVEEDLADGLDWILDAGPTTVGLESTVLRLDGDEALLLRPGGIPIEELEPHVRVRRVTRAQDGPKESPGMLESHYAPWTPMTRLGGSLADVRQELDALWRHFEKRKKPWPRLGFLAFDQKEEIPYFEATEVLSRTGDLYEASHNLFAAIRRLDKHCLDLIVAEGVPERGLGLAIADRLEKASGGRQGLGVLAEVR